MDDVFDAGWRERFGGRDAVLEAELARQIDIHGASLLDQTPQLRLLLTQARPDAQEQIGVLLAAVSAGVARRLRGASDDPDLPALLKRCVEKLQQHGVADPDWAWWGVRTWAHAFALPVGSAPAPLPSSAPVRAPFAPWQADAGTAPAAVPAGEIPIAPRVTAPSVPPFVPDVPLTMQPVGVAPAPEVPLAAPPVAPHPEVPLTPRVASASADAPDAPIVEPASAPIPIEPSIAARREPVFADQARIDATDAPPTAVEGFAPTAPTVGRAFGDADAKPRRARPALVGVAIVLLVALGGYYAWSRYAGETQTKATPPVAQNAGPASPDATASPPPIAANDAPSSSATAPTPPIEPPKIDVAAPSAPSAPPATNAAPPAAATTPAQTPPAPAAASTPAPESTAPTATPPAPPPSAADATASKAAAPASAAPMKPAASTANGPGASSPASSPPASPSSAPTPPPSAPTPAPAAPTPAPAAPTPAPAAPAASPPAATSQPAIAKIDVPRVVEGAPFTVVVRLASPAGDVVGIERRIGAARGAWPPSGPVSGVKKSGDTLRVPFAPLAAASRATIDFVAIGRDGGRSEPKSVTITVAEATPADAGASSCTPATCGTVVESADAASGTPPTYRITVRGDDGASLSVTAPYRLQAGTRVRVIAGRVVPLAS